jgi:arylsulfatase A-like enzyme
VVKNKVSYASIIVGNLKAKQGNPMNRRDFLSYAGASAVAALLQPAISPQTAHAASKPNIVFFFVDDMGWQDTSEPFHSKSTALNRRYHTPNMEQLADEGMKFTSAYACTLCSPSRVSMMTGMNAARHGVTNWTLRKDQSPDPAHKTLEIPTWNVNGLTSDAGTQDAVHAKTLPMFLQEAGYHTIHAGKAHWGAKGTPGENPLNLGFDVNIAGHAPGGPGSYLGKNNFSAAFRNADLIWDVPGLDAYYGKDIYLTEALTLEANKAIDHAVTRDKPFFLNMSHYAIHAPWEKDDRFYQPYADNGLDDWDATYASMIEGMDKSLGDIRANLRRHGIEDNTVIIFMSDNGQPKQADPNLPLKGHKLTPYEGGMRVPAIVKWPGVTKAASTCEDYFIIEDMFPTLLAMGGVDEYEQIGGTVDGVSIEPLLRGTKGYPKDRPIFWHFPHSYDQYPFSAVRKGDWKLIYFHEDQRYELFNLEEDIGESHSLHETRPDMVQTLAGVLGQFLREADAAMPVSKDTLEPVPYPG